MVSPTALAAAVRDVLRADRDGDGVPDVLVGERPAQDRRPPPPAVDASRKAPVVIGVAVTLMVASGMAAFLMAAPKPRPVSTAAPQAPVIVSASAPPSAETTPLVAPSAVPSASASVRAPALRPAPKLTNEQFGKNVVAAQQKKLLDCVEQDLLRKPDAPKAYTVTVFVERDGLPLNSATKLVPEPSRGFRTCATHAIFYGFNGYGRNAPEPGEFTFTTSFAFPNAKPAAKASSTWE